MPLTLHAAWLRENSPFPAGKLFFWSENLDATSDSVPRAGPSAPHLENGTARERGAKVPSHPFQASVGRLRAILAELIPTISAEELSLDTASVWLPTAGGVPMARRSVLHGRDSRNGSNGKQAPMPDIAETTRLAPWQVTGVWLDGLTALTFLSHLSNAPAGAAARRVAQWGPLRFGNDLVFWSNAAKVALGIMAGQHYLPGLRADTRARIYGVWQPSFTDQRVQQVLDHLIEAMPPVCRAYNLESSGQAPHASELVEHFLAVMVDDAVRMWSARGEDVGEKPAPGHWLQSLATGSQELRLPPQPAHQLYQDWRTWTEQLHVSGDTNFRICFALIEPDFSDDWLDEEKGLRALNKPDLAWKLKYYLQARDNPSLLISAADIWSARENSLHIGNLRLDQPQERLLAGLAVASRLFAPIARSLRSQQPASADLSTSEAYQFLREIGPLLESSGFGLKAPAWWHEAERPRLGLRLRLLGMRDDDSPQAEHGELDDLDESIRYAWELTLGGERLSAEEFDQLAAMKTPLIRFRNSWVELDPQQVEDAKRFITTRSTTGSMTFLQALRMAQGYAEQENAGVPNPEIDQQKQTAFIPEELAVSEDFPQGLPLEAVGVEGWLEQVLIRLRTQRLPQVLDEPAGFVGVLRPYQKRGVGWLEYLRDLRLGACLADDMGLGKTIQAIAMLLRIHNLHRLRYGVDSVPPPTLLVCPTSVVANWKHEVERFAPQFRVLVHHGINRLGDENFLSAMRTHDLAITSYGTARRDIELLLQVRWGDLILDEAQNIKNPRAKQTQAVRRIKARNRIALTGTPVENQLGELWSIMEFLNPAYLGGYEKFRKQFIVPIERYNDDSRAQELRSLVQPFLLRRLKSDPTIISDLPEKLEMVVYCTLTKEQGELYEQTVQEALAKLASTSGIQRRGLVLGLLTKLKQISNHPAHFLRQREPLIQRSGKLDRLTEMLDEALSIDDRALIFTQFVEMGHLIQKHLQEELGVEVLFLHGGTQARQRDQMVRLFQRNDGPAVFVLSLRAGGSGLNLTRANHVFHYDRWWNPAVEDQATDRAFRIGQTRNVQVHKFVVAGTLEERIHEMIESKQALAQAIVGSGEEWLTELNNDQLRDLLTLRHDTL